MDIQRNDEGKLKHTFDMDANLCAQQTHGTHTHPARTYGHVTVVEACVLCPQDIHV